LCKAVSIYGFRKVEAVLIKIVVVLLFCYWIRIWESCSVNFVESSFHLRL
jgi:hypothetical protein